MKGSTVGKTKSIPALKQNMLLEVGVCKPLQTDKRKSEERRGLKREMSKDREA